MGVHLENFDLHHLKGEQGSCTNDQEKNKISSYPLCNVS